MNAQRETRLVLMTAPDAAAAERLVRALVDDEVIACGNIVPGMTSIYRWRGEVETASEVLVIMKTTAGAVPRLLRTAPELHPYEVPEILVLPLDAGHPPYLDWVAGCVRDAGPEGS